MEILIFVIPFDVLHSVRKIGSFSFEKYAVKFNYENNDEIDDENLIFPFNLLDNGLNGGCQPILKVIKADKNKYS